MKKLTTILLVTATISASRANAEVDYYAAGSAFAEANALSHMDGATLWGVDLYGPMLLVDPFTRHVVANEADDDGHLQPVLDAAVFAGTLPDDVGIANTAVEWAGKRWTMLRWPLPTNKYARGKLLIHELYHRIQPEIGLPATDAVCPHLDRDGRELLRLEMRALAEALIAIGDDRNDALQDAVRFRVERQDRFDAACEQALELNEGLAEYTGFVLSGLPEHVIADRVAVQLDEYDHRKSYTRSFAYATGPAYGVLLDEVDPDWRDRLTHDSDLGMMARDAYALRAEAQPPLHVTALAYGGAELAEEETARLAKIEERERIYQERFVDGPRLILPDMGQFRYSFNPNAVDGFGDHGTVYRNCEVSDLWGSIAVGESGAMMVRDESGRITHCIVPAPPSRTTREWDDYVFAPGNGYILVGDIRPEDMRIVIR